MWNILGVGLLIVCSMVGGPHAGIGILIIYAAAYCFKKGRKWRMHV